MAGSTLPRWTRPLLGLVAIAGGIAGAVAGWDAGPAWVRAPAWGALAVAVATMALLAVVMIAIPAWMRRRRGAGRGPHR